MNSLLTDYMITKIHMDKGLKGHSWTLSPISEQSDIRLYRTILQRIKEKSFRYNIG